MELSIEGLGLKKPITPEMYICSFLSANTNTNRNTFEKNKKIQIRVKILPQNVFENTNTNTFHSFFRNAKDAKSNLVTVPNRLIRIFPEGRVLYSERLTIILDCPMKLQKFPLDNQTCTINIGSCEF